MKLFKTIGILVLISLNITTLVFVFFWSLYDNIAQMNPWVLDWILALYQWFLISLVVFGALFTALYFLLKSKSE